MVSTMENKYAIIEKDIVVNVAIATPEFAQEQGWVSMPDYVDGQAVGIGWGYVDGVFIPPPAPDYTESNKQQAQSLLQQTDWTATVDISNPLYSNPYLANQNDFLAYRSQVRQVAINPPSTQVNFPPVPDEVWVNV